MLQEKQIWSEQVAACSREAAKINCTGSTRDKKTDEKKNRHCEVINSEETCFCARHGLVG